MTQITELDFKIFDAASLTAGYQALDTIVPYPCYEATIFNDSNVPVTISTDGSTDNLRIGAGKTLRLTAMNRNKTVNEGEYLFPAGMQLYIANKASGTGFITANLLMTR